MNNEKKKMLPPGRSRLCHFRDGIVSVGRDPLRRNSNSQITPISLRPATPMRIHRHRFPGQFSFEVSSDGRAGRFEVDDRGSEETNEFDKSAWLRRQLANARNCFGNTVTCT